MKINAKKKLNVLALIIFMIFIFINIFWIITMYIPYSGYISKVDKQKTEIGMLYEKKVEDYIFKVSPAHYLGYDAFLSISKEYSVTLDENGNMISSDTNTTLFIWPNIWTQNEYGIMLLNESNNIFIQAMVDENGHYLQNGSSNEEYNHEVEEYLDKNQEEISKLLQMAKKTWGLNFKDDIKTGLNYCFNNSSIVIITIVSVLLTAFMFIALKWSLRLNIPFKQYLLEMNLNTKNKPVLYEKKTDEFIFHAKKPTFLFNNGYLMISYNNSSNVSKVELLIYPQKRKKIIVYCENTKICMVNFLIDGNDEFDNAMLAIYSQHIIELINTAKEFWDLKNL